MGWKVNCDPVYTNCPSSTGINVLVWVIILGFVLGVVILTWAIITKKWRRGLRSLNRLTDNITREWDDADEWNRTHPR